MEYSRIKLAVLAAVLLLLTGDSRAEPWRGIVPLKSTRADVERLLGKPTPGGLKFYATYKLLNEKVTIQYSVRKFCGEPTNCHCRVPDNTVLEVSVVPRRPLRFSALNKDLARFTSFPLAEDAGIVVYYDAHAGLIYSVRRKDDRVLSIQYSPTAKDCEQIVKSRLDR